MPRRLTPFQVRLEIYVQSQIAQGRSAADVAREDLKLTPAMMTEYRIGDSLPNPRDLGRAQAFQQLFGMDEAGWDHLMAESQRIRAQDDQARDTELRAAVQQRLALEVERHARSFRGPRVTGRGGAAAQAATTGSAPTDGGRRQSRPQPGGGPRPIKRASKRASVNSAPAWWYLPAA